MTLLYYGAMPPVPLVDPLSNEPGDRANPDRREPDLVEQFDGLTHVPGVANSVETVVNAASQLVNVSFDADPAPVPQGDVPDFEPLGSDGSDGNPVDEAAYADSLAALETVDDVALLAVPDEVRFATPATAGPVTAAVIAQCERRKDRFALVSSVSGLGDVSQLKPPQDTAWAAFYYPWIDVQDPISGSTLRIPSTGHIAGVIARSDTERGVHKAPANEELRGAIGLEFQIADSAQDVLNPRGVNAIRDFRAAGHGIRVWGARTMSSDPEWKYVNVRRFLIFLEASIDKGTQWVVFEPNGERLWGKVPGQHQRLPASRLERRRADGQQAGAGVLRQARSHDDDAKRHRQRPASFASSASRPCARPSSSSSASARRPPPEIPDAAEAPADPPVGSSVPRGRGAVAPLEYLTSDAATQLAFQVRNQSLLLTLSNQTTRTFTHRPTSWPNGVSNDYRIEIKQGRNPAYPGQRFIGVARNLTEATFYRRVPHEFRQGAARPGGVAPKG